MTGAMMSSPAARPVPGAQAPGLSDTDLAFVCDLIRRRSAIVLNPTKRYLVESRLATLVRAGGHGDLTALVAALRRPSNTQLAEQVVDALTTNETSFYRDLRPFEMLRQHVLPALLQARATTRALTFWSAACSSGQEPYSLALLLLEHFPQLRTWNIRIIASDLSPTMLARAAAGSYSQLEVSRGLPAALLTKYFTPRGRNWEIKPEVRSMVEFRTVNLAEPWGFLPPVDVLFLRNVLIYFDLATKQRALAQARQVLRPDGYLVLGGTETTLGVDPAFTREQLGASAVYRPTAQAAKTTQTARGGTR